MNNLNSPACSLNRQYAQYAQYENHAKGYLQEGDIMIGIILDIFTKMDYQQENFTAHPAQKYMIFSSSAFQNYRHFLAAIFAIKEINKNQKILPNLTLGFHIHDSWASERKAITSTFSILTGSTNFVPNYKCNKKRTPRAFVGHLLSSISNVIYQLNSIFGIPQVSYGAVDKSFSDKIHYPLFYRTLASETAQYQAVIQLIKIFGWNWVGMIFSDDESHQKASEEMKNEIIRNGICAAFVVYVSEQISSIGFALKTLKKATAKVVIVYSTNVLFLQILINKSSLAKHVAWLILASSPFIFNGMYTNSFNGSIFLISRNGNIPGLQDFIYKANPSRSPYNDPFTASFWLNKFKCQPEQTFRKSSSSYRVCDARDTLHEFDSTFDINKFRRTYNMYIAIYSVAHALHAMYTDKNIVGSTLPSDKTTQVFKETQLHNYLKKVNFKTSSGDNISFNGNGEVLGSFVIINWNIFLNGTVTSRDVGTFVSSRSPELVIDKESIHWPPPFNRTPTSSCGASCLPGYRKVLVKGKQICCYECVQCSEGEISPLPDMENCMRCLEDQWSNEKRNKCIMRDTEFLSYEDPLGVALTVTALFLSSCTAAVFCIFVKYKNNPIVKANNQELSYLLILSLFVSFLCSLLFIGRPMKVTCLLRQALFGFIFAINLSSILGKTITVMIAFNATQPGSRLRNFVGTKVPKYILLLCTLPEVLICTLWLIISPPFPDYDTHSVTGKIILQCNEGSSCAFYIMVGYIALLAFVSFFVAYLARKLPDIFNEAQYITFSMLLFCSVWISFILAYLSTKGKYLAAMEIFAILVSSAGLLCLIFIPKCFIILFKPPACARGHLVETKQKQNYM
ncbi:vomeronasal type-2 receptor 26 [Xenopus laevis]|uniref:Vomeronasal type-2 receptor 26 n=1 Tax=Xenopus laevis TaxID=8355 RepID=A0A8J0TCR9_XENLA|nr:vomeronasal type-2 receptor 26 [Xenopus laevis]